MAAAGGGWLEDDVLAEVQPPEGRWYARTLPFIPPTRQLLLQAWARLTPRCMRAADTYEYLLHQKFFDSSARLWTKIAAGTCANGYAPAYYVFVTYRADGVAPLADKRC